MPPQLMIQPCTAKCLKYRSLVVKHHGVDARLDLDDKDAVVQVGLHRHVPLRLDRPAVAVGREEGDVVDLRTK